MKSDLIEHPCVVCKKPSRSCGHTKHDVRAYNAQMREMRRLAKQVAPKHRVLPVPAAGPAVFHPAPDDSRPIVTLGKRLRGRFPNVGKKLKAVDYESTD
jgi:hypothetical protein